MRTIEIGIAIVIDFVFTVLLGLAFQTNKAILYVKSCNGVMQYKITYSTDQ